MGCPRPRAPASPKANSCQPSVARLVEVAAVLSRRFLVDQDLDLPTLVIAGFLSCLALTRIRAFLLALLLVQVGPVVALAAYVATGGHLRSGRFLIANFYGAAQRSSLPAISGSSPTSSTSCGSRSARAVRISTSRCRSRAPRSTTWSASATSTRPMSQWQASRPARNCCPSLQPGYPRREHHQPRGDSRAPVRPLRPRAIRELGVCLRLHALSE